MSKKSRTASRVRRKLTERWASLSGRRDLTENLSLRIEPIIERTPMPIAPLRVELIGPLRDQDMQVIAGRNRLTRACGSGSRCLGWCARRRSWLCLFCLARRFHVHGGVILLKAFVYMRAHSSKTGIGVKEWSRRPMERRSSFRIGNRIGGKGCRSDHRVDPSLHYHQVGPEQ